MFLSELAWRWCFGIVALAMGSLAWGRVFGGVHISDLQISNLRSENVFVVAQTIKDIFVEVLPKLLRGVLGVSPILAGLWLIIATAGRSVTFRFLKVGSSGNWWATSLIHLFRLLGALLLSGFFLCAIAVFSYFTVRANPENPNYALYFTLVALAAIFLLLLANVGNWYLALAPLFSVVEGQGFSAAIESSRQLSRKFAGELGLTTGMFFFVRLIWFAAMGVLSLAPVALFQSSVAMSLGLLALLTLFYFAGADFLYIARMAAYWHILERDSGGLPGRVAPRGGELLYRPPAI